MIIIIDRHSRIHAGDGLWRSSADKAPNFRVCRDDVTEESHAVEKLSAPLMR